MESLSHWFLINIVSPIMLPLCLIAVLCILFGSKPEPIMKAFIDMTATVFISLVSATVMIGRAYCTAVVKVVRIAYEVWRSYKSGECPRPLPPDNEPKPRRRTPAPKPGQLKYKLLFAVRRFITKT